ncbi:MAG: hypothetical protein WKF75_11295 [Singulisphaera sp.]
MTALVQKPSGEDIDPPPADLGLIRSTQGQARIEVQVFGGSSVLNARMKGFLQKIDEVTDPITGSAIDFFDNGQGGDRDANNGVYTALIPIDRLARDAEYRVSIQALSTAESRNIEPEDPNKDDEERRKKLREQGNTEIALKASEEQPEDAKREEQALKKASSSSVPRHSTSASGPETMPALPPSEGRGRVVSWARDHGTIPRTGKGQSRPQRSFRGYWGDASMSPEIVPTRS